MKVELCAEEINDVIKACSFTIHTGTAFQHSEMCIQFVISDQLFLHVLLIKITFKKFGFGPDFVKWVSVLMADDKSCVAYCGGLSEYFAVEAGIRQGSPFSPLAFVLVVELLAIKIRQCENIKGLNYWKARNGLLESIIKIALYADDLTLFLKDKLDMQQALEILAEFSTFPGLEINRMKSEAMWLGSKQNCTDTFFGFVWKRRLNILGVYFACDKCPSQVEESWTGRVENIKRIINAWEKKKPEHCWQSLHYKNIFNFTVCIYHASIGSPRSCSHSGKQNII